MSKRSILSFSSLALAAILSFGPAHAAPTLKAECKAMCTGPACGGRVVAEFVTDEEGKMLELTDNFKGITLHAHFNGQGASMGSPQMDSFQIFMTRGQFPNTQILGSSTVLLDLASIASGGRVLLRADWSNGGRQGNLAAQCLVTKL